MKTEDFAKTNSNVQPAQNDVLTIGNAWLILNGVMESLIALTQVTIFFILTQIFVWGRRIH